MKCSKEKMKSKKVMQHLKEDKKEYREMAKDDTKLMKSLKKKKK